MLPFVVVPSSKLMDSCFVCVVYFWSIVGFQPCVLGKSACDYVHCLWSHCNFDSFWNCSVLVILWSASCTIPCCQPFKNNNLLPTSLALFFGWEHLVALQQGISLVVSNFVVVLSFIFWTIFAFPLLHFVKHKYFDFGGHWKVIRDWLWWCAHAQYDSSGRFLSWFFFPPISLLALTTIFRVQCCVFWIDWDDLVDSALDCGFPAIL